MTTFFKSQRFLELVLTYGEIIVTSNSKFSFFPGQFLFKLISLYKKLSLSSHMSLVTSWASCLISKHKNPKHMVTTWRYILVQASNQGVNPGASNCKDLFGKALETRGSSVIEATVSDNSLGPISLDGSLWKSWKVKLKLGMGWVRPSGSLMVTSEVNLAKGSNNSTEVGFFYEIDSLTWLRFEIRQ